MNVAGIVLLVIHAKNSLIHIYDGTSYHIYNQQRNIRNILVCSPIIFSVAKNNIVISGVPSNSA